MTKLAMLLPIAVCLLLGWRVMLDLKTDWKLATCLAGTAIATSLILLLGSERLLFLKYGDAVIQVNQRADEVRGLTDLNKRIAKLTAKTFVDLQKGVITTDGGNTADISKTLEELLKASGATSDEIDRILERTNTTSK